jgi:hypothetical protein
MYVKKIIQTEEGAIKFEGELTQEEADLVVECGLNWLLREGALPLLEEEDKFEGIDEDNIQ